MTEPDAEYTEEVSRRGVLATVGLAALAGCSASGSQPTETTEDQPLAHVSFGYMTGDAVDPETYNATHEDMMQISADLESVADGVTRVDATVITDEGSQTGTWLIPEHIGENRILGSRNVYDEDDVINPEYGDWIEVRAWKNGDSHPVQKFKIES